MKTFCPNCEKQTDSTFICEVHMCNECNEDNGNYEKPQSTYWKTQAVGMVKQTMELTAFLRKIMLLGLLRGSPRLTARALEILDGFEQSDIEGSVTQDIGKSEIADQVMKIIGDALSGDCQKYLQYDMQGKRYCKWGIVEKDIRALFDDTNPDYHNPDYSKTSTDNNKGE